MPDTLLSSLSASWLLVSVGLGSAVAGMLLALWLSRRRARNAFSEGMTRQAEKDGIERMLLEERLDVRDRDLARSETSLKTANIRYAELEGRTRELTAEHARAASEAEQFRERLTAVQAELAIARRDLTNVTGREAELRTRLEETRRGFEEKEALFRETSAALKQEFSLLANKIFEEQGESFAKRNRSQLEGVLSPFREQITEFKARVEQVYHTESKDRASLLTEVRNLQRASEKINQEAENLTKALKGDKRIQGNWGELVLERVLEQSGLRRDHEYEVQASLRNAEGDARRPDVIIHLPDDKDVVVDSKVSLVAYEGALAAEDDGLREQLIKQHVLDLRAQVKRLAEQDYDRLEGLRSLDFVLLFIPIESAFTLAMEEDQALFTEAFNQRIVIVSPTTLMMTLRIIHNVWRYEKQNRNAQEIAQRAGALYDKLRGVMEEMSKLGTSLRGAESAYQTAMKRLATGRGSLVRRVEQFRELGASPRKQFPKELLDESADASDASEDGEDAEEDDPAEPIVELPAPAGDEEPDAKDATS